MANANRVSESNPTGVRSFDHTALAALPEYRQLQAALDKLAHAANAADLDLGGQQGFLNAVVDAAAGMPYGDHCSQCRTPEDAVQPTAHPFKIEQDESGWLNCFYRCAAGHTWRCGYGVSAPLLLAD